MYITSRILSASDLGQAAREAGVTVKRDYSETTGRYGRRFRLTLALDVELAKAEAIREVGAWNAKARRVMRPLYQRTSANPFHLGRRIPSVCWHGYGEFMYRVLLKDPSAVIRTGHATYHGLDAFLRDAPETGDRNVGSQVIPVCFRDACVCEDSAPWEEEAFERAERAAR